MNLSDLLGADVADADGRPIGRVRDVRLVQDGPLQGTFGAGLRVDGLIVGPTAISSRLGYDRFGVDGPWLVAAIARRLQRRSRYVPWPSVESMAGRTVHLSCSHLDLAAPAPLPRPGSGS
ncbi:PRC-barrel domain-containing protein [Aquihabitans sp. McL0605]|uniref:PRC-barrel domain-containing protein n=1 Tax=Aquihabitans sp. McL0605 TaxID=3415671 RepID=UPI003CF2C6A4